MADFRLKPFDGALANKILDAANVIIRFGLPEESTSCPKCGEENKLFYGDSDDFRCAVCEWEERGIIPLRDATLAKAQAEGRELFDVEATAQEATHAP